MIGMNQKNLKCCPHCSSKEGYYLRTQIRGACDSRYKFDGTFDEQGNDDMHDHLKYEDGKVAYCRSCQKRLFKVGRWWTFRNTSV